MSGQLGSRLGYVVAVVATAILVAACGSSDPALTGRSSGHPGTSQGRSAKADGPIEQRFIRSAGSGRCAASDAGEDLVSNRPGSNKLLVPSGAVKLVLCSYNGMNPDAGRPDWALRAVGTTTSTATIVRLGHEMNAIRTQSGSYSCPFDQDSDLIATFVYRSGTADPVTLDVGGCEDITNGHVSQMAMQTDLVPQLEHMAKPVRRSYATLTGTIIGCTPADYTPLGCTHPSTVVVSQGNHWIGTTQPYHGRFRLTLATAGRVTVVADGEGQQVNAPVASVRTRLQLGHTTNVRMRQAPFGEVVGHIIQCDRGCETPGDPQSMVIRIQTPTQIDGHNLDTYEPNDPAAFSDDLPPGRYKLSLFTASNENTPIAARFITVRAHHVTRVNL